MHSVPQLSIELVQLVVLLVSMYCLQLGPFRGIHVCSTQMLLPMSHRQCLCNECSTAPHQACPADCTAAAHIAYSSSLSLALMPDQGHTDAARMNGGLQVLVKLVDLATSLIARAFGSVCFFMPFTLQ